MKSLNPENLQILIVEDDTALRTALRRNLGVIHSVYEAGSCEQARGRLAESAGARLDLVLLDKGLPDGDGLELISEFLAHSPQVAIIVLTGDENYRSVLEAIRLGAHDFLVKSESLIEHLTLRIPIAIAHAKVKTLNRGDLADAALLLPSVNTPASFESYKRFLNLCEKTYLELAIKNNSGHLSETANSIGLARSTLWKKMGELGMKGGML
jgi:DNA-binding NtrC family response regulator